MNNKERLWTDAMRAKGHKPVMDEFDGELDIFAFEAGHHNGPGCEKCGWHCCWHCTTIRDIPKCGAAQPPSLEGREYD